jgi:hypothetical protein
MDSRVPDRINRATFDRVLQRAAELQAASKDIGEGLSEEEILALGAEVGIPTQHLRQALIEERTRVVAVSPTGVLDRWVGPADFVTQRVVQGSVESVGAALTKWVEREEHLVVQRAVPGRITFEPMEAFAGAMRRLGRMFDAKRGKPYLDKAELVTAMITPLEAGFCHVSLAASLRRTRRGYVTGGSAIAVVGAGMGLPVLAFYPQWPIVAAIAAAAATVGLVVARAFRPRAKRAQLGLERALDELERKPALPRDRSGAPQIGIAREVGRVVRDITKEVRKGFDE